MPGKASILFGIPQNSPNTSRIPKRVQAMFRAGMVAEVLGILGILRKLPQLWWVGWECCMY